MGSFLHSVSSILNHKIGASPHQDVEEGVPITAIAQGQQQVYAEEREGSESFMTSVVAASDSGQSSRADLLNPKKLSVWSKLKGSFHQDEEEGAEHEAVPARDEVIPKSWYQRQPEPLEIEIPIHQESALADSSEGSSVFQLDQADELDDITLTNNAPEEKFEIRSGSSPVSDQDSSAGSQTLVDSDLVDEVLSEEERPVVRSRDFGVKEKRYNAQGLSLDRHLSVLEELEKKMLYSHAVPAQKDRQDEFETLHYYRNRKGSHFIKSRG